MRYILKTALLKTALLKTALNVAFIAGVIFLTGDSVSAQLFGERTLGRSINRRQSASMDSVGAVDSSRRFIRGKRRRGEVVGVNKSAARTFVGREEASPAGPVTSSVAGLREQRVRSVNQPRRVSATGRYPERLRIDFETPLSSGKSSFALPPRLQSLMEQRGIQIEVSEATRSVILRGVVPSAHDREIAELLVLFEPGIEKVVNELTIE